MIRSRELETGLELLSFTIAGIVALCGVNSAGVAVWCNAVYQLASSLNGVPVVCVARSALSQWTLEAAEQLIRTVPHASGQNYLVGGPSGIHALECSARLVVEARPDGNSVWHTNHPLASEDLVSSSSDESSLARDAFTGAQLRRSTRVESLQRILADRNGACCKIGRDSNEFGHTLWAVVVEHIVPPEVYASPGPPTLVAWERLPLGPEAVGALRAAGPPGNHRPSGDP